MDAKTFAATVARKRPTEVQEACLTDAVEHYLSQGQTQQSHVAGCIQLAGRFAIARARPQGNPEIPDYHPFPQTPGLIARSDELTRRITPAVEQVRQELFGKTPAPFSSYAETAAWIEQMGEQQDYTIDYRENAEGVFSTTLVVQNQALHHQCMAVIKEIETKYREDTELTGDPLPPLTTIGRVVPYLRHYPNGALWVENFPACTGSPLARLADVSQEMAEATGFQQHSVVMFILMGTKPLLSSGHVTIRRMPHKKWDIVRVQVSVEINTADVMEPQLRAIQQVIRQAWGMENTAPISADDQILLSIVDEHGGVPATRGSKTRFWQQVQQAWNRAQRQNGTHTRMHNCWQSTERNYARLTRKLAQQVSGTKEPRGSSIISLEGMSLESISSRRTRRRTQTVSAYGHRPALPTRDEEER